MDAQRVQGWALLLSTAGLGMPGCDPEPEPNDDGASTSTETGRGASTTSGASEASAGEGEDPSSGSATQCERWAAKYVECYPGYASVAEASESCVTHIAYLEDVSEECAETYLVWIDYLSYLDCSELQTDCLEETTAHGRLLCI